MVATGRIAAAQTDHSYSLGGANGFGATRLISPLKWKQYQRVMVATGTAKGTSLRECALFEPSSVKISRRVSPPEVSTKKVYINKNNVCYFSPISREDLRGQICTKCACIAVGVADVITCDKFFRDRLKAAANARPVIISLTLWDQPVTRIVLVRR